MYLSITRNVVILFHVTEPSEQEAFLARGFLFGTAPQLTQENRYSATEILGNYETLPI